MSEQRQTRLADDVDMPEIGSLIGGRYLVESVLGEGGFATVYRCADNRTKTHVAVKVLDPMMSRRGEFAQRFLREIETVSRLRHHNTIKIFDAGETDKGCLYLVMELLTGQALDEILETTGPLPPQRVKHITVQILKSLMEAHQGQIMHRDLKPANVFIADVPGETDYVKVLDFGIAKSRDETADTSLTATGQVMCSPDYVAPERVRDHACFFSSDLYSLGIMMLEMLEGELPYKGDTPIMVALQHARVEDPVPLKPYTANGPLGQIIQKAVHKDAAMRYQSAADMLQDLAAADCEGVPVFNAQASHLAQVGGATTAYLPGGETVTDFKPQTHGDLHNDDDDAFIVPVHRPKIAIAIGAILILGVLVALGLALRGSNTTTDDTLATEATEEIVEPVAQAPAEDVAPIEEVPEPVVAHQTLTVNTIPQGASVLVNDEVFGVTPYILSTAVVETFPAQITFELEGYEALHFDADDLDALLALPLARTQSLVALPPVEEPVAEPTSSRSSSRATSRNREATPTNSFAQSAPAASTAPAPKPAAEEPAPKPAAEEPAPRRSRIGSVQVRMND